MTDHEQRDAEILRRREEGVPYREIGQQFGISHGRDMPEVSLPFGIRIAALAVDSAR